MSGYLDVGSPRWTPKGAYERGRRRVGEGEGCTEGYGGYGLGGEVKMFELVVHGMGEIWVENLWA